MAAYDLDVADVRDDFIAVGVPPDVVAIVTAHVLARSSPFTTGDIIGATGASRGTVTKVLKQLLKAGKVEAEDGQAHHLHRPLMAGLKTLPHVDPATIDWANTFDSGSGPPGPGWTTWTTTLSWAGTDCRLRRVVPKGGGRGRGAKVIRQIDLAGK